ncbi:hypothetical protein [Luteibacter rhizovicinus]|uniref:hypothetical protein n=1 Tax=Luteibacter rhizovicinus TaxID=242606 RepID=UPI00104433A3|nr:hypothetical protein [Luteibacter rhizovicinus]
MWISTGSAYQIVLTKRENVDMKIIFAGFVLIAAAVSANASGIGDHRDPNQGGYSNAPVCPDGQVAQFVGVINGKATWRCVPA